MKNAPSQSFLMDSITNGGKMNSENRQKAVEWMRNAGGPKGIDHYLEKYNIDVIIGPADCECIEPPAAAGWSCSFVVH